MARLVPLGHDGERRRRVFAHAGERVQVRRAVIGGQTNRVFADDVHVARLHIRRPPLPRERTRDQAARRRRRVRRGDRAARAPPIRARHSTAMRARRRSPPRSASDLRDQSRRKAAMIAEPRAHGARVRRTQPHLARRGPAIARRGAPPRAEACHRPQARMAQLGARDQERMQGAIASDRFQVLAELTARVVGERLQPVDDHRRPAPVHVDPHPSRPRHPRHHLRSSFGLRAVKPQPPQAKGADERIHAPCLSHPSRPADDHRLPRPRLQPAAHLQPRSLIAQRSECRRQKRMRTSSCLGGRRGRCGHRGRRQVRASRAPRQVRASRATSRIRGRRGQHRGHRRGHHRGRRRRRRGRRRRRRQGQRLQCTGSHRAARRPGHQTALHGDTPPKRALARAPFHTSLFLKIKKKRGGWRAWEIEP